VRNTAVENSAVLSKKDLVCNISVEASEWHVFVNHVLSHMGAECCAQST